MIEKSILLVGNGSSLKGSKLGKKIDEFDEIIRINDWKTKGFEEDVGLKTSIWTMYNPEKNGVNFINGYKNLNYDILDIVKLVKDIKEIWFVCWKIENLMEGYKKSESIKQLYLYNKIKRHESIITTKKIKEKTNPPSTGFTLIWLLTSMYNKIYIVGFDFGNILNSNQPFHHYYGNKLSENVIKRNIHNMKLEYDLVKDLEKQGKIEFLTQDTKIKKSKFIGKETEVYYCNSCNENNFLYDWEQKVCQYCENKLI